MNSIFLSETYMTLSENLSRANDSDYYVSAWAIFFITFGAILLIAILTIFIQNRFKKINMQYTQTPNTHGKTGKQVAEEILAKNNITNVMVLPGTAEGQDHYNPSKNQIVLSPSNYNSRSVSAAAVAAHEAGHAIQWARQEFGIKFRDTLAKPVQAVTAFSQIIFGMAFLLIFFAPYGAIWFSIAAFAMFGAAAIFQLATLPVEFGASKKALRQLDELGYLANEQDKEGTKKVLRSAASTYVVATLTALIMFALIIFRMWARKQRRG